MQLLLLVELESLYSDLHENGRLGTITAEDEFGVLADYAGATDGLVVQQHCRHFQTDLIEEEAFLKVNVCLCFVQPLLHFVLISPREVGLLSHTDATFTSSSTIYSSFSTAALGLNGRISPLNIPFAPYCTQYNSKSGLRTDMLSSV